MFEKEAEEYAENREVCGLLDAISENLQNYDYGTVAHYNIDPLVEECFKDGAEFGYNKANEWHYVKDGDLPNTDTKDYTYIRRRKKYERQFTDYRVIKCYVLCINEYGKITADVGYFDCNRKCFFDKAEGMVYAWKEIVLPKESE